MPRIRRSRTLPAPPEALWRTVGSPHHLRRWWPRVERVENVDPESWTIVMTSKRGRTVRADYRLVASEPARRRAWEQELEDSPFERLLASSVTEIRLEPAEAGTRVTIELRQKLRGWSRFGGFLFRRAGRDLLDEALDGLEATSDG
jgi:uncharacterized protein YndB with AHSA1/START domain